MSDCILKTKILLLLLLSEQVVNKSAWAQIEIKCKSNRSKAKRWKLL